VPDLAAAPAADGSQEEVLEEDYEDELEREQKERDQYPNEMTASEIDDVVERELLEFEAKYDGADSAECSKPE
jgi:hypothetical protein